MVLEEKDQELQKKDIELEQLQGSLEVLQEEVQQQDQCLRLAGKQKRSQ